MKKREIAKSVPRSQRKIVEMDVVPIILMRVLLSARRIERNMVNQQAK